MDGAEKIVSGPVDPFARLAELGLRLPEVVPPLAAYVPAVQTGDLVYVSGQVPVADGELLATGKVGADSRWRSENQATCSRTGLSRSW